MSTHSNAQPPWYRQFWPWFLFGLPGIVVVASFATLFIALKHPHSMVDDAYYEDGLAINQSLDQDRAAAALRMSARVMFEPDDLQILITLEGDNQPVELNLQLMHPASERFDQLIELQRDAQGNYQGSYSTPTQTSYYLRLMPPDASWRLNGEVDFRFGTRVLMSSS
jgi:uncharacterized protein